jgi:hypothetical protein
MKLLKCEEMKLTIFYLLLLLANTVVAQNDTLSVEVSGNTDLLSFDKHSYNLGEVKKGEIVNFDIQFKNTGNEPVVIDFVSSCDCTEVEFPTDEIMPGESGVLKVKFDSSDKEESETTDIDVFLVNKDPESGTQMYYTLEYSFKLIK